MHTHSSKGRKVDEPSATDRQSLRHRLGCNNAHACIHIQRIGWLYWHECPLVIRHVKQISQAKH